MSSFILPSMRDGGEGELGSLEAPCHEIFVSSGKFWQLEENSAEFIYEIILKL